MVRDAHAYAIARPDAWLTSPAQVVEEQFRRRGLRTSRRADMPLSTSPMDAFINPIRGRVRPRAYALKNPERAKRMLMLMQLHANRQDNQRTYTKSIRQWLEANGGRPAYRRALVHVRGVPSLH